MFELRDQETQVRRLKALAFDVDGTLTDGSVWYESSGASRRLFNIRDGMGFKLAKESGLALFLLTGSEADDIKRRAEVLGVDELVMNCWNKADTLERLMRQRGWGCEEACFMGDDVNDLDVLQRAGVSACPSDAVDEVRRVVGWISEKRGGHGAARELIDWVLRVRLQAL